MTMTYQEEYQAKSDRLRDSASALIAALGADWTVKLIFETDYPTRVTRVHAIRADGMQLNFYPVWNKPRLEISPIIPARRDAYSSALRDWGVVPYNTPTPGCTVALDRAPAQAAKQITRAVIEPYAPMYAAILVQRDADTARDGGAALSLKTLVNGLAPLGEVRVTDNTASGSRSSLTVLGGGGTYRAIIEATLYDHTADLKIPNVPIALAIKIAALVEADRAAMAKAKA